MPEGSSLSVGHVVLADLPDPSGAPCGHPHPAMILRGPSENGIVYLVAISTSFERPLGRLMIELPWAEGGHPDTGLSQPCVLKCFWVVRFDEKNILRRLGRLPSEIVSLAIDYVITHVEETRSAKGANESIS